jgi:hypothetical protein
LAVFWLCVLRNVELPGLYMDAVNPDYLFARWLNPELKNPVWAIPNGGVPLLGNLYHGMQTLYVGVLTYGVLGTSVVSVRVTHALYGSLIVLLTWLILRRASGRPVLATVLATALATDMAFVGSFRTQAYIILAGQVWMMLALWLAVRSVQEQAPSRGLVALSGMGMGMAVYGYFVFLFFLPPVAALAVLGPGRQGMGQRLLAWSAGFVVGMLPYVIGYVELAVALGGMSPLIEWMRNVLGVLGPTVGRETYGEGLGHVLGYALWGLAGLGNEHMVIGEAVSLPLAGWRTGCVALAAAVCLLGAWLDWHKRPSLARVQLASGALPVSYIALAAGFGSRLDVHHFTVLVAVGYLLLGLGVYWLALRLPQGRWMRSVAVVLAAALLVLNVTQQNWVHARLVATGGVGMTTDALSALARTALTERERTVWFFPEWGFFMPFAFLTANKVPYENELTTVLLGRHAASGKEIRVAFWKEENQRLYGEMLEQAGIQDIQLHPMYRRDGQVALYVLAGVFP